MEPNPAALAPRAPLVTNPVPAPNSPGSSLYVSRALTSAATRVRTAGIGNRHPTILNEARGPARFIKAGLLAESVVTETLIGAGEDNDRPQHEIEAIIAWALDNPSQVPSPEGDAGAERKAAGPDPRRKEPPRAACRLLRHEIPSDELLAVLHWPNEQRGDPLPRDDIGQTTSWAARRLKERPADAR